MTEEKPVAIVLPTWNPNEPRFKVEECPQCSDDRTFKNNKCVFNQRLGFAYSVEELVALLNGLNNEIDELKNDNAKLEEQNEFLQKRLNCIIDSLQKDLNNYGMMGRFK